MSSGAFGAHAEVVALGLAERAEQFEARGIEVVGDVLRDEALAVFRTYRKAVDSADGIVVYNARGGTE